MCKVFLPIELIPPPLLKQPDLEPLTFGTTDIVSDMSTFLDTVLITLWHHQFKNDWLD